MTPKLGPRTHRETPEPPVGSSAPPLLHHILGLIIGTGLLSVGLTLTIAHLRIQAVAESEDRRDAAAFGPAMDAFQETLGAQTQELANFLAASPEVVRIAAGKAPPYLLGAVVEGVARWAQVAFVALSSVDGEPLARFPPGVDGPPTVPSLPMPLWHGGKPGIVAAAEVSAEGVRLGRLSLVQGIDPMVLDHLSQLAGGDVLFVEVAEGRLVPTSMFSGGSAGNALVRSLQSHPQVAAAVASGGPVPPLATAGGEGPLVVSGVPLKAAGNVVGYVLVGRSQAEQAALFRQLGGVMVLGGVLALCLTLPLGVWVGRRLSGPITAMAAAATALRDGRHDVDVPGDQVPVRELSSLARSLSSLARELREKASLEAMLHRFLRREARATGGDLPYAGRYDLRAVIGAGGMGRVYRAHDRVLGEDVALKRFVTKDRRLDDQAIEGLKRELILARRITHPNVIRVFDLGLEAGEVFITMELLAGQDLRALLKAEGRLGLEPALLIARRLCRGLEAVHRHGIVHRDIKPANVMVLGSGAVKVMDFGVSRASVAPEESADHIGATPAYMAPEHMRGEGVTGAVDVYAVGVVLFEMLSGHRPFRGKLVEVLQAHAKEPPPPLLYHDDILGPMVRRCMAKEPKERPDIGALRGFLDALNAGTQ